MDTLFEIFLLILLVVVQSIFGVGLLLFGTPSFLLLGYDFPNTINILMPISISISLFQFFNSKIKDKNFITEYNYYCLPFLFLFLILALTYRNMIDFKFYVAVLLIISSLIVLNKNKFSNFFKNFIKLKKIILIFIGSIHGFTNMGGNFLSIYSILLGKNKKKISRYYISYGYLSMGIIQYLLILLLTFNHLNFSKLYYVLLSLIIYIPSQKIFDEINNNKFSKIINWIALIYGILIISKYLLA